MSRKTDMQTREVLEAFRPLGMPVGLDWKPCKGVCARCGGSAVFVAAARGTEYVKCDTCGLAGVQCVLSVQGPIDHEALLAKYLRFSVSRAKATIGLDLIGEHFFTPAELSELRRLAGEGVR